jgi:hypothetical protein
MRTSGIRYDLTIEPGLPNRRVFDDPYATGRLPDYREAPREPYRPSKKNFLIPESAEVNDNPFWMVPLTTTAPGLRLIRRPPYLIKASHTPNLALHSKYVWPHLRVQLNLNTKLPLVIVLRTGDLDTGQWFRNFSETTQQLVKHPALADCEFTNVVNAIAKWQAS